MYLAYAAGEKALHKPGREWVIDGKSLALPGKDADVTFTGTTAVPTEAERRAAAEASGNYLILNDDGDFVSSDRHGVKRVYIDKPVQELL